MGRGEVQTSWCCHCQRGTLLRGPSDKDWLMGGPLSLQVELGLLLPFPGGGYWEPQPLLASPLKCSTCQNLQIFCWKTLVWTVSVLSCSSCCAFLGRGMYLLLPSILLASSRALDELMALERAAVPAGQIQNPGAAGRCQPCLPGASQLCQGAQGLSSGHAAPCEPWREEKRQDCAGCAARREWELAGNGGAAREFSF